MEILNKSENRLLVAMLNHSTHHENREIVWGYRNGSVNNWRKDDKTARLVLLSHTYGEWDASGKWNDLVRCIVFCPLWTLAKEREDEILAIEEIIKIDLSDDDFEKAKTVEKLKLSIIKRIAEYLTSEAEKTQFQQPAA